MNNHLNTAITEAKSAFNEIQQNITQNLTQERNYEESPTDAIAAKMLTSEAFKAVNNTENGA